MSNSSTVTEADILAEIIAPDKPGLDPDAARAILRLQFNNRAGERICQLLDANNGGKISDAEHADGAEQSILVSEGLASASIPVSFGS